MEMIQPVILVVDDESDSLKFLSDILRAEGYEVRAADSGKLALASAAAHTPDLILLDLRMPGMDGLEVCRRLRESEATRETPLMLISGAANVEQRERGLALGAVDFVTKPFRREELAARVHTHLELGRLRANLEQELVSRIAELQKTEERLSMAAESAEAGLWELDYRTNVFWATERTRTIFGLSPDEIITLERVDSIFHSDDRELVRSVLARVLRERCPVNVEHRIVLPDGSVRWVDSRGRPHFTPAGEPHRLMGVTIDITERKRTQEALRLSEARMASAASLAGLAFYELDYAAGTAFVDDRMRALSGLPPDREQDFLPVQFWMDQLHPDDRQRVTDLREQMYEGKFDRMSIEYRFLHPVLGQLWIDHLANVAARDANGRALRVYGVLRDITTRRQAEDALRQSLAEIEHLKDKLQAEGEYLKAEVKLIHDHGEVIGRSAGIYKVLHMVEQVAATDTSVLVQGETGTGKELVAQALHRLSPRRNHVMVKVNCAALPGGLVESELFGREKGAYTGAMIRQIGRLEIADNSTLFLDEVGELPLELQAKLLRVLESGEFERLGSPRTIKVNVRFIAATNRDLPAAIKQGKFREDLYYRLNVFPIQVPPLRERAEDIPLLVWAFLGAFSSRMGKKITRVPRKTMEALQRHSWPGNVRELRNVIERGAIITTDDTLRIAMLDETAPVAPPRQTLEEVERQHILQTLERTGWRIKGKKGAADELGLNPGTLYGRMRKLGIRSCGPSPTNGAA